MKPETIPVPRRIIQKYGGTSVGNIERIQAVAGRALDAWAAGNQVSVVVSAMAGETNRLVDLACQIDPSPYSREYDLLIASGEQISVGLVSLAINAEAGKRGVQARARPFLAFQLGILTDSVYSKARIQAIDTGWLKRELEADRIPVIAGFQGVDPEMNITTLGRGGSDTSAVAIAAALGADDCEIYTDVDGVYTCDPRLCRAARKISRISYEEMMELAGLGAKVLQIRSVELAAKFRVPLHVRSSFSQLEGTRVVDSGALEKVVVAGIAADQDQVKFAVQDVPDRPGVAAALFGALARASIVVDVIVQDTPRDGRLSIGFTTTRADEIRARGILGELSRGDLPGIRFQTEGGLAKVSIVGVGMQNHPGVAARMFELLAQAGANIRLITTSEIKISCLIEAAVVKQAVEALHEGFGLGA